LSAVRTPHVEKSRHDIMWWVTVKMQAHWDQRCLKW
jgi:hypothetical protein